MRLCTAYCGLPAGCRNEPEDATRAAMQDVVPWRWASPIS